MRHKEQYVDLHSNQKICVVQKKAFSQSKNHAHLSPMVSHGEQFSNVIRFPIILANTKTMTRKRKEELLEEMPNKPKVIFCSCSKAHQVLRYRLLNMFSVFFLVIISHNGLTLFWFSKSII